MYSLSLFILFFAITLTLQNEELPSHVASHLPPAKDVSLVLVGFRHGYRNPAQFFKNDATRGVNSWGWEGASQLTNIGKQQAFSLGEFLRKRYSDMLSALFFPSQFKAVSSSAERSQQTLQCVMNGLYPPKGRAVFDDSVYWQPVPYEINDPLLRMYNVKCPTYTEAYQSISDDNLPESVEWLKNKADVTKYIAQNSGFNASLSDLADAADNVQSMLYNKVKLPDWIEKPTLEGYTKESMIKEILSFAEAHQIQCAQHGPCAKAMAGLWLDHIIELLNKRKNGDLPERRAMLYAAHTETVLSLIRLMKLDVNETITSAGFILEFKTDPPSVRVFTHEPDREKHSVRHAEVVEMPYCAGKDWCPLETFIENVSGQTFHDWREFCHVGKCDSEPKSTLLQA